MRIFFALLVSILVQYSFTEAQILQSKLEIKVLEDGLENTFTDRIKIIDRTKNYLADINVSHSSLEDFKLIEAKIIDKHGKTVRKVKSKNVVTTSSYSYGTFYQDEMNENFTMYWSDYPYIIEYSYQIIEPKYLVIANWSPIVDKTTKIETAELIVDSPIDFQVRHSANSEFLFEEKIVENRKVLSWKIENYKPLKEEKYSTPFWQSVPYVRVIPLRFNYDVAGESSSWKAFGNWYYELNKGLDELNIPEQAAVDNLISTDMSQMEKICRLYEYLQGGTQYVNVKIDVGGWKSYPAKYVCVNKYGDCKALTTYMKALLKYIGIKSHYVLVNADSRIEKIDQNFPSPQFNHVILAVPLESQDTVWLENTSVSLPCNYLGTFTQGRMGLLVDEEESQLIKIPNLESQDVQSTYKFDIFLDEEGNGNLNEKMDLRGDAFEEIINYKKYLNNKELKTKIEQDSRLKNFTFEEYEINTDSIQKKVVSVVVKGILKDYFRHIGDLKIVSLIPIETFDFDGIDEIQTSIELDFPINEKIMVTYHLESKEDYVIELSQNTTIESEFGKFSMVLNENDTIINFESSLQIDRNSIPKNKFKEFKKFINRIENSQRETTIILKQKE